MAAYTLLINNGAISKFHTRFEDLSAAQFDQVMTVNVRGAMLCARAFVQANRGLPYGRIINIASTRWQQNEPGWDAYGASKGALVALTQSLANSLADYPITVNAISPGWIQAEDYHTLTEADHRQHPSGRVGRPDDITRACLFLADPQQRLYQRRQSGGRWRDEQEDDLPHLRLLLGGVIPCGGSPICAAAAISPHTRP